jgi:tRNA pseudouridine38-40 synthase
MARYQVILVYDGTEFFGFQRQARERTVQGVVEDALRRMGWQGSSVLAAGRTDTGVHASGQVIAFDLDWSHSTEDLRNGLNANLPGDVAAQQVAQTHPDFHPRYDALARRYRYQIFCQPDRNPLRERYAWRVWPAVKFEILQQAADYLPGRHDFSAFGTPPRAEGPTERVVSQAGWQAVDDQLTFEVVANAFLYRMVRRLVSTQVAMAQGKIPLEVMATCLAGQTGGLVQGMAPPHGLFLVEVIYPPELDENQTSDLYLGKDRR